MSTPVKMMLGVALQPSGEIGWLGMHGGRRLLALPSLDGSRTRIECPEHARRHDAETCSEGTRAACGVRASKRWVAAKVPAVDHRAVLTCAVRQLVVREAVDGVGITGAEACVPRGACLRAARPCASCERVIRRADKAFSHFQLRTAAGAEQCDAVRRAGTPALNVPPRVGPRAFGGTGRSPGRSRCCDAVRCVPARPICGYRQGNAAMGVLLTCLPYLQVPLPGVAR